MLMYTPGLCVAGSWCKGETTRLQHVRRGISTNGRMTGHDTFSLITIFLMLFVHCSMSDIHFVG
jgi:hypothetical protein